MTVSSPSSRVVYAGDGTTTAFPFAFKVPQAADLAVVYTDATGTDVTLPSSQYAASGFGADAGGTVTYPLSGSPIASGTTLALNRCVAAVQPAALSNQGAMWPQVIEAALDRIVMICQGVIDTASRALVVSPADGGTLGPLPNAAARANAVLGFDGAGQPYAARLTGGLIGVSNWLAANFLPMTSAAAARTALGAIALGDVGAGATIAAAGSYALPNGLIVKWGTSASVGAGANATIAFAAAFPTALFGAVLTPLGNTTGYASNPGASSFKVNNNGANSGPFFWVALGN